MHCSTLLEIWKDVWPSSEGFLENKAVSSQSGTSIRVFVECVILACVSNLEIFCELSSAGSGKDGG